MCEIITPAERQNPPVSAVSESGLGRRNFLGKALMGGALGATMLALPACQSMGGFSLTEAVRRMLLLSSDRAFARLTAPGGYWDDAVARLDLNDFLGARGDVLGSILTSALFKSRLEDAFADIAVDASYRAAPVVTEAVKTIGIANALALINGGPNAATTFLRREMPTSLVEAMVPEVSDALRAADDPLVGQALAALTGIDMAGAARHFAGEVDNVIWEQIGVEEAAIRADPSSTHDPMLISVLNGAKGLGR
ncbi:DUF4197 domain-containing protein [Altericroceibacterium spongiae]|uniref:DUF4197 domain-containing protein n=1 Tax=Altericroceibacterium spongiae TaxID=2320269 RepID=A0A420EKB5_9SPHN|nr:DUF4197 domain-containing protein [Altericroceibacterium spongiae]RKF21139.1 DUF4197 domain-containing protein [Altericroceibacterium spongiae]